MNTWCVWYCLSCFTFMLCFTLECLYRICVGWMGGGHACMGDGQRAWLYPCCCCSAVDVWCMCVLFCACVCVCVCFNCWFILVVGFLCRFVFIKFSL